MLRYIIIRTIWIFIVLYIILSLNFLLLKLAPDYPPTTEDEKNMYYARQVSDGYMTVRVETDGDIILAMQNGEIEKCDVCYWVLEDEGDLYQYRIYEPVPVAKQYFSWVGNIITEWNWGVSTRVQQNEPVFSVLMSRIPVTLRLNLLSLVFYIPIGFTLGIVAALKKNSVADNLISLGVMIFISVPSFVIITLLILLFAYQLHWFPSQFPSGDLTGWIQIQGMVIPVLGLSFGAIAVLTRLTRAELTEVLTSEFVLLARTKGLTRRQAVIRHAMRNSMVPLVPTIIFSFVGLLSGSVIIEIIYGIPGTARIYLRALAKNNYDYNLILGITAFYTIIGLFAVLLVDLSYGIVDPRIRMGARR